MPGGLSPPFCSSVVLVLDAAAGAGRYDAPFIPYTMFVGLGCFPHHFCCLCPFPMPSSAGSVSVVPREAGCRSLLSTPVLAYCSLEVNIG